MKRILLLLLVATTANAQRGTTIGGNVSAPWSSGSSVASSLTNIPSSTGFKDGVVTATAIQIPSGTGGYFVEQEAGALTWTTDDGGEMDFELNGDWGSGTSGTLNHIYHDGSFSFISGVNGSSGGNVYMPGAITPTNGILLTNSMGITAAQYGIYPRIDIFNGDLRLSNPGSGYCTQGTGTPGIHGGFFDDTLGGVFLGFFNDNSGWTPAIHVDYTGNVSGAYDPIFAPSTNTLFFYSVQTTNDVTTAGQFNGSGAGLTNIPINASLHGFAISNSIVGGSVTNTNNFGWPVTMNYMYRITNTTTSGTSAMSVRCIGVSTNVHTYSDGVGVLGNNTTNQGMMVIPAFTAYQFTNTLSSGTGNGTAPISAIFTW